MESWLHIVYLFMKEMYSAVPLLTFGRSHFALTLLTEWSMFAHAYVMGPLACVYMFFFIRQ